MLLLLVAKSCPTLSPPGCSPPGSSVRGFPRGKNTHIFSTEISVWSPSQTSSATTALHMHLLFSYVTHTHVYLCNWPSCTAHTLWAVFCWGLPGLPDSFPSGSDPSSFSASGVWEGWLPPAHPGLEVTRKPGPLLDQGKNPFCGGGQARRMFSATKNTELGADQYPLSQPRESPGIVSSRIQCPFFS